jgi:metallo-beta-lactamase family protein
MANSRPSIRLSFHGAAGCVTGSKYLLEVEDRRILIDCGLFQGKKELRQRNWETPPFDPSALDAIVLTHAHIDHTGYLPKVVRSGFNGPVYATPATIDLLGLLLPDAAYLEEEGARYANKHGSSKHRPAKALFTQKDAKDALKLLRPIPRGSSSEILSGIRVTPACAGHILGSTSLNLDVAGRRVTFSGDIGRYDTPILPDPAGVSLGDVLLCESTYGNREHAAADIESELAAAINRAAERKGALLIPAFAIGRTQNLLYYIAELERLGKIPVLPVFVDSPMAVDATGIYRNYKHDYDEEASEMLSVGETPLLTENTSFCKSRDQSKRLNGKTGARIIISASGMVTGGRILHHMAQLLPKETTSVLFVGYQAEGTRGRKIQAGCDSIKMLGRDIPVRAHVETISGLSAHGDRNELLRWLKSCKSNPSIVKIVHGEPDASSSFSHKLKNEFSWKASPAEHGETIEF